MPELRTVAEIDVDPARATVFEHGWQSWSPTTSYRLTDRPYRPRSEPVRIMNYRPDRLAPADAFQGEGLLAVDPGNGGPVTVIGARDGAGEIAAICADVRGNRVLVSADAEVTVDADSGGGGLAGALGRWAERFAQSAGVGELRSAPTVWCSWYHYFTKVRESDIEENVAAMDELSLDFDVVQIDDGYQAEIGDWLVLSDRFASLRDTVSRIRDRGRRAGIWLAPFLVSPRSELAAAHPDWLIGGGYAGFNWNQSLSALDVTNPAAADYLTRVFATFREMGFDYFKIDFCYAGALPGARFDAAVTGVDAYRAGLRLIREAIGADSYLLGCGAPILPSVGLVDAMRVSPDISLEFEPDSGDLSQPSQRAAELCGRGRSWQHGRFWVNDPDCLIARPAVEHRERWADHVARFGGLRAGSDRLLDLDEWGLEITRRLIVPASTAPFPDQTAA